MRLPNSEHTYRPWRIHELTRDFRLEDVWALPTPGGPDDLQRLVRQFASHDARAVNAQGKYVGRDEHGLSARAGRVLFALRWKLGELFGWDEPETGLGGRVSTLRDRLPADLREAPPGPDLRPRVPFTSVFQTHDEWAAEIANRTVHAVMHIGWVADADGGYRGQMAVLVKPNGLLGRAYMAAIAPFRRLIVYPALTAGIGRDWHAPDA
jgi:hypothetical protein